MSEPTAESVAEQFGEKPVCKNRATTDTHPYCRVCGDAMYAYTEDGACSQACSDKLTPPQQPEPTYTMQQANRVCKGDGIVIGGELIPYEHEFRVGDTVRDSHGQTGTVTRLSGTRFVNINDQPGYRNCESLTLVSTEHRLYTMQQAIDKIVDGLVLEWAEVRQGYWGAKKNCFAATVDAGMYRVWEEFGQCWYGVPGSLLHPQMFDEIRCESLDSGQQLCLADYRSRVRSEIERTVNRGS